MKRKFVRTVSFAVAFAVVCAAAAGVMLSNVKKYEDGLVQIRLPALSALCESAEDVSLGLRTMSVSSDESLEDSKSYVRERSGAAIAGLFCFDPEYVKGLNEYFEAVYSFAESSTVPDRERALILSDHGAEIYYHTDDMLNEVLESRLSLLESDGNYFEKYLDMPFEAEKGEYERAEAGPFAASETEISRSEAAERAGELFAVDPVLWRDYESGSSDGIITYDLRHGEMSVRISRADGRLCSFKNPLPCNERSYSPEAAERIAAAFLEYTGIENGVLTDSQISEFTASFVFCPKNGSAVLLTSPVYMDICLASGKVTGYNAAEYLKHYSSEKSAEDAHPDLSGLLPEGASAEETMLCLRDVKGRERFCYRVKCLFRGEYYYLYYDYSSLKNIFTEAVE